MASEHDKTVFGGISVNKRKCKNMPCKDAMITDVVTVYPDQTVGEALALFEKHKIRTVPVIDEQQHVLGLFSFGLLLDELLPISDFDKEDENISRQFKHIEISLDFLGETATWVAHRLKHVIDKKVSDIMRDNIQTVSPESPIREGIRLLVKQGSPLPVVENGKLVGIISSQTAVKTLIQIMSEINNS